MRNNIIGEFSHAIDDWVGDIERGLSVDKTGLSFVFGPFSLCPARQLLLRENQPIRVGGRAFDILTILVSHPGEIVSKRKLMELVWPGMVVEECNLKVNVAALRRMLGDQHIDPVYIATVVGRGYRFVSPIHVHRILSRDI